MQIICLKPRISKVFSLDFEHKQVKTLKIICLHHCIYCCLHSCAFCPGLTFEGSKSGSSSSSSPSSPEIYRIRTQLTSGSVICPQRFHEFRFILKFLNSYFLNLNPSCSYLLETDHCVLLPKWFTHREITLAKGQNGHSYTFWSTVFPHIVSAETILFWI